MDGESLSENGNLTILLSLEISSITASANQHRKMRLPRSSYSQPMTTKKNQCKSNLAMPKLNKCYMRNYVW